MLPIPGSLGPYTVMPFSILPFRLLYSGQRLAVVAHTPAQEALAQAFVSTMSAWHPAFDFNQLGGNYSDDVRKAFRPILASGFSRPNLTIPVVPPFASCIMSFSSTAALEAYVTATQYDTN